MSTGNRRQFFSMLAAAPVVAVAEVAKAMTPTPDKIEIGKASISFEDGTLNIRNNNGLIQIGTPQAAMVVTQAQEEYGYLFSMGTFKYD